MGGTAAASADPAPTDPTGEWMVAAKYAEIRIVDCSGTYWGVVAWEKLPGGIDKYNPDPNLRGRPTMGMPVLMAMKPSDQNEWSGQIYNSQDGRTYSAKISLSSPDVLSVRGCVLGFLCGGEDWTRVTSPQGTTGAAPGRSRSSSGRGSSGAPQPVAQRSSEEICSALPGSAGSSHERRLK